MQFHFDAHQEYQRQAVEAVTDLFEGQARIGLELSHMLTPTNVLAAVGNRLDLDDGRLLANLHAVQERNGLAPDDTLRYLPPAARPFGPTRR